MADKDVEDQERSQETLGLLSKPAFRGDSATVPLPDELPGQRFWGNVVAILLFFGFLVLYVQRINISIAIIIMADDFGWSSTDAGVIMASFYGGYILTQVIGGTVANKKGGAAVYLFGVIASSVFTFVTALVADNFVLLVVVRFLMGVGEGVTFPSMYAILGAWIPKSRRAGMMAVGYTGTFVGTIVAMATSDPIAKLWGWQAIFYTAAIAGVVWSLPWMLFVTSYPYTHRLVKKACMATEADTLALERVTASAKGSQMSLVIPWGAMLSHRATWAIIVTNFSSNWGFYVLLSWIPKFFKARYGLDLGTAGFLSILPYLGISICSLSAGRLADVLVKRGFPLLYVRKTMQCVAFLIPACLLTALTFVNDTAVGVSIVVAAVTITGFNSGGNAVNHLDVGPRYAAVLLGFSNTAGTIPGIIGVASAGVILDMLHSWNPIFYITAGIYVVGTMVFTSFAKTHVIFS